YFGHVFNYSTDEQATVRAAGNRKLWRRSVLLLHQIFRISDEVGEDILLLVEHSRLIPRLSVFAAPPDVRDRIDASHLHPHQVCGRKRRSLGDIESTVSVESRKVAAVETSTHFHHYTHQESRSILARVE